MSEAPAKPPPKPAGKRPPWRSRFVLAMLAVTLAGAALWGYAAFTAGDAGTAADHAATAQGFAPTGAPAPEPAPTPRSRLIDEGGPATVRLGLSFLAAYFVGWVTRMFLKASLLIAGAIAVLVVVLDRTEAATIDWAAVRDHVEQGLAWTRGRLDEFRDFVLGYVPSAVAAGAGLFLGFRRA